MKKLSQKGFTLVEGLLIVIALSLFIGVGYYVYSANKDNTTNAVVTNTPEKKSTPKTTEIKYLEIKELGIKIPLTKDLEKATYEINSSTDYAGISTPEFADAVGNCKASDTASASFPAVGVVAKHSGTYDISAATDDIYFEFIKQLPGFYLEYGNADGGFCNGTDEAKNKTVNDMYKNLEPQLKTAVKQAQAI